MSISTRVRVDKLGTISIPVAVVPIASTITDSYLYKGQGTEYTVRLCTKS